jgi:two-component system nitrate/nitrite response regulator NarL
VTSTAGPLTTPTERPARRDGTIGVLVVDDSLVFRTGMSRAVKACDGLELVGEADGGAAALAAIAELQPDLVILDLRMPEVDGLAVLRALRAQDPPPACRVLVISASIEDGVEEEVMAAGADGCLSKALTRAEICEVALRIVAE